MSNREKAINFWKAINERFPHERVQNWINTLESDQRVDWFRNFGLAKIALSENSVNKQGRFSNVSYEKNEKAFKLIVSWYSDVVSLMQN
jgi:hypothetical protein